MALLSFAWSHQTNAQCFMTSPSSGSISYTFQPNGGSTTQYFTTSGCPGNFSMYPSNYSPPAWLNVTIGKNSTGGFVTLSTNSANTSTTDRTTSFSISHNGQPIGGVQVKQLGTVPPPDCVVTVNDPGDFAAGGQTKNFDITYTDCSGSIGAFQYNVVQGNDTGFVYTKLSDTRVRVQVPANSGTAFRRILVSVSDTNPNTDNFIMQIDQACQPKQWYPDTDNDGFRDPGSSPDPDCANRGSGWTLNTAVDSCPSIPYNSNNGCPPPCTVTMSPTNVVFQPAGGNASINLSNYSDGCLDPKNFTYSGKPGWLSISPNGSKTALNLSSGSYSGVDDRGGQVTVFINGENVGSFTVVQEGTPPPPDCVVTVNDPGDFAAGGQTKNFDVTYTDCSGSIGAFQYNVVQGDDTGFVYTKLSDTRIRVQVPANSGPGFRQVLVSVSDANPNTDNFVMQIDQACQPKQWYLDTDNDGFRDPGSSPDPDCANRGSGWTLNTAVDSCPSISYDSNNGCPPPCTVTMNPTNVVFQPAGGSASINLTNYSDGCMDPKNFTFSSKPGWLSISPNGSNTALNLSSGSYSGVDDRGGQVTVFINGENVGSFTVVQEGTQPPPDCVVTVNDPGDFAPDGQTKNFDITYTDCSGSIGNFQYTVVDGDDTGFFYTKLSDTRIEVQVPANIGVGFRRVLVSVSDSNPNTGDFIMQIDQDCIPRNWYPDTDGDGKADSVAAGDIVNQCIRPTEGQWTDDPTLDVCPGEYSTDNVLRTWYPDTDRDGLGDPNGTPIQQCEKPVDYAPNNFDLCPSLYSPSNDCIDNGEVISYTGENYIYSRTYQEPRSGNVPDIKFLEDDAYIQQITYFDGIGRPLQEIGIRQSGGEAPRDIVTHFEYDQFGRMAKEWLPIYEPDGALGTLRNQDMDGKTKAYYAANYGSDFSGMQVSEMNPYAEKLFENAPLNRVEKQGAPGKAWLVSPTQDDHAIEFAYESNTYDPANEGNTANDNVRRFSVDFTNENVESPILVANSSSYYGANELMKNIVRDENHSSGKDHTTEEYTDKNGRVVLKRTFNNEDPHDTYYVYDVYGNLSFVIPPKVDTSDGVSATERNELCYQYVYDFRNRLVEKKIPGKAWEYIVYNDLDQPILTQDGNQRNKEATSDEWLFTKYDVFGRVAYMGLASSPEATTRTEVQVQANGYDGILWVSPSETGADIGGATVFYNNGSYPNNSTDNAMASVAEVLMVNYYDRYHFDHTSGAPTNIQPLGAATGTTQSNEVRGLITGTRVKVLDTNSWITSRTYYDEKGRPIYSHTKNDYLGTVDIVESQLNFIGKVVKNRTSHIRNGNTIVTLDSFTYDHVGRLLTQTQCIGDESLGDVCEGSGNPVEANLVLSGTVDSPQVATNSIQSNNAVLVSGAALIVDPNATNGGEQELIVLNSYDKLGLLQTKKVGGDANAVDLLASSGLQMVGYNYNVRGWLKGINDEVPTANTLTLTGNDLWGFRLQYDDPSNGGVPLFNGNISQTLWKTASVVTGSNAISERYTYSYDPLNRITSAIDDTSDNRYSLTNIEYDKNGNIQKLKRNGHTNNGATSFGVMDDLTYSYTGNQLKAVDDDIASSATQGFVDGAELATEYTYDANGNLLSDLNKGITDIDYNYYDLPTKVTVDNPQDNGTIDYVYAANGTKIRKAVIEGGVTTTTDYASGYIYENNKLRLFPHSQEGYVEPKNVNDLSQGFNYIYQYKDHLGNVRLSYSDNNNDGSVDSSEIIEEKNYYPFGLVHKGYNFNINGIQNNYQTYNGKEFDVSVNMNMYDLGARIMDPALGRFMVIDPMAVFVDYQSPYVVADNNPIANVDFYGLGKCGFFCRLAKKLFGPGKCNCKKRQPRKRKNKKRPKKKKKKRKDPPHNPTPPQRRAGTDTEGITSVGSLDITVSDFVIEAPVVEISKKKKKKRKEQDEHPVTTRLVAGTEFNLDIPFTPTTTSISDEGAAEKVLNDLITTLKEYPLMKVSVDGVFSTFNQPPGTTLDSRTRVNGGRGPVEWLTGGRANKIIEFLKKRGVNANQLIKGKGKLDPAKAGVRFRVIE